MIYSHVTDRRLSLRIVMFCLLHTITGKLQIHTIDSLLEELRGNNVTLPCHFSGYEAPRLELPIISVRWTLKTSGEEKLVYMFSGGDYDQNRPKSYMPHDGLLRGDASLHIPSIQVSDEGEYTCHLIVTPEKAISSVTLLVLAKPTCTVSDSRLEMNPKTERTVKCYADGFHPANVKIQGVKYSKSFTHQSKVDIDTFTSVPVQNKDGTYNATSVLFVTPDSTDEDRDVYSCIILHRSLRESLTCNLTLAVQPDGRNVTIGIGCGILVALLLLVAALIYILHFKKVPPKVNDINEPEVIQIINREIHRRKTMIHMNATKLECVISCFRPRNIHISLYFEKENYKTLVGSFNTVQEKMTIPLQLQESEDLILEPVITLANRVYSCNCYIYIRPNLHEHNGSKLILEVNHEALTNPIYKELKLEVMAPPVLNPIEANRESYNVGDQLALMCKIHSFYPQNINVIWYKEEERLSSSNKEVQEDGHGLYYITSYVEYTVTEEDFGKTLECKVKHQSITDKDEGVTWRLERKTPPVLDPIKPNQESYKVGDHLELMCKIHSFHPRFINVIWYKEGEILTSTNNKVQKDRRRLSYVNSCLHHTVKEDDFGKTFRCKVQHQSIPENDEGVTWKLQKQAANDLGPEVNQESDNVGGRLEFTLRCEIEHQSPMNSDGGVKWRLQEQGNKVNMKHD